MKIIQRMVLSTPPLRRPSDHSILFQAIVWIVACGYHVIRFLWYGLLLCKVLEEEKVLFMVDKVYCIRSQSSDRSEMTKRSKLNSHRNGQL